MMTYLIQKSNLCTKHASTGLATNCIHKEEKEGFCFLSRFSIKKRKKKKKKLLFLWLHFDSICVLHGASCLLMPRTDSWRRHGWGNNKCMCLAIRKQLGTSRKFTKRHWNMIPVEHAPSALKVPSSPSYPLHPHEYRLDLMTHLLL